MIFNQKNSPRQVLGGDNKIAFEKSTELKKISFRFFSSEFFCGCSDDSAVEAFAKN